MFAEPLITVETNTSTTEQPGFVERLWLGWYLRALAWRIERGLPLAPVTWYPYARTGLSDYSDPAPVEPFKLS